MDMLLVLILLSVSSPPFRKRKVDFRWAVAPTRLCDDGAATNLCAIKRITEVVLDMQVHGLRQLPACRLHCSDMVPTLPGKRTYGEEQ